VGTSISEESAASVFVTEEATHTSVYPSSTLKMEAAIIHGMLVFIYQDTWQLIPEYLTHKSKNRCIHRWEILWITKFDGASDVISFHYSV